jgi:hypothetical protein
MNLILFKKWERETYHERDKQQERSFDINFA